MNYFSLPEFQPSRAAALSRLAKVDPALYETTRNYLNGAVTCLSPWMTHGFLTTREAAQVLNRQHQLAFEDKIVFEFGWREFFKHVHENLGNAIFSDIKPPVGSRYRDSIPKDVVSGCTGVKAVDQAVKLLYQTGYLHNHARLWLASYLVHLRKINWRVCADWMYGHLLDGELASNHLSWQWVAGTFSSKPYLFNNTNVEKFAPMWASRGTSIEASYEELERIARSKLDVGPERTTEALIPLEQPTRHELPTPLPGKWVKVSRENFDCLSQSIDSKSIHLVHPWDLAATELADSNPVDLKIGIVDIAFHSRFPWSRNRWDFVTEAMGRLDCVLVIDSGNFEQTGMLRSLLTPQTSILKTENPGYCELIGLLGCKARPVETILPPLGYYRSSFSSFYRKSVERAGNLQTALKDDEIIKI